MKTYIKRVKGRFAKGHIGYWTNHKMPKRTDESKLRYSLSKKGFKNPNWKGNKIKYPAVHGWLYRNYGQPKICEHCESTNKKMYHWANISNTYKRDRRDWLRLCVSCHKRFDLDKKAE